MKAKDIREFLHIIQPVMPAIEAVGFHHYAVNIFRRILNRHIFQDILFAWPRNAKNEFNLYLEIRCPGDMMLTKVAGKWVNYPFFHLNVASTFCCTEMGRKLEKKFEPPPYSFDRPFPYLGWFLYDIRPVWEEWYGKFCTPQSLVDWCLEGGDICGINKYEAPAPVSYRSAAVILAYMGRNREALEAFEQYHRLLYEDRP